MLLVVLTTTATALIISRRAQSISFTKIAVELNNLNFVARRGGTFNQKQVKRLYDRALAEA
jgi:hypothetical protein